jgi:hypothetical protein
MNVASLWQRAHVPDDRLSGWGVPLYCCAGSWARALSVAAGFPPWQSAHLNPFSRWTSLPENSAAGVATR